MLPLWGTMTVSIPAGTPARNRRSAALADWSLPSYESSETAAHSGAAMRHESARK
jgi:hypothetical protein